MQYDHLVSTSISFRSKHLVSSPTKSKKNSPINKQATPTASQKKTSSRDQRPVSLFFNISTVKPNIAELGKAISSIFNKDLPKLLKKNTPKTPDKIGPKQNKSCPSNMPKAHQRSSPVQPDSVSIKEACRIKEWVLKAKPEIEKMWRKIVNSSHGIKPLNVVFASYKAYIGKGNNAGLIKKLLLSRSWWQVVEHKEEANFIWTQWKDKPVLESLKTCELKIGIKEEYECLPFVCPYKAQIATRVYKTVDMESLGLQLIKESSSYVTMRGEKINPEQQKIHNRLEFNECLSNKKDLLVTMKEYYMKTGKNVFEKLPLSFSVTSECDNGFKDFLKAFQKLENRKNIKGSFKNLWIVKPGEFTNRGQGIFVCKSLSEISEVMNSSECQSFVLQKYIEKPLLINKRKFDIRCYSLMASINGVLLGYFYLDGYLRTSSSEYSVKDTKNLLVHLTNDAVQKFCPEYGKYENANKLSFREFQKYLDSALPEKRVSFFSSVLPRIKNIVKDTMTASSAKIDPLKRLHSMEIFGYDFMIDYKFRPWLIEVNTNPCFELSSPYLAVLIPAMIDNALKLTVDCVFPPPLGQFQESYPLNRFELIFHQAVEGLRFDIL